MTSERAAVDPGGSESPLVLLAILGQALIYLSSVVLARQLDLEGFDAYVVTSAVFLLLVTMPPLGSEKYALRALPVYVERGDWPHAHGYMRFGVRRVLCVSALLVLAVIGWAAWPGSERSDTTRLSIAVAALALPVAALVHFGLEVLTACGCKIAASAIFRIAVPGTALACIGVLHALPVTPSAPLALACWGPAWVLGLVLMLRTARRRLPPQAHGIATDDLLPHWRAESRPFFVFRLSLGLLGQSALIAMAALQAPAAAVGAYAAAVGTAGLAAVLATSTNRAYAQRLSILLELRDHAGMLQLRRERLRWMLPALIAFVAACFVFGDALLALFRPEFAEQGRTPLRILAVGTAVSVLLSLAPTYLKYQRRRHLTYATVAGAALAQVGLLLWLVPTLGATGAALANAGSIGGMYVVFAWLARRELTRADAAQRNAA